jgi:DNA-binding NarL/FixJ family response regulator
VIRVLVVDDHPIVRDGIRGVLANEPGFDVVGEAGDGREALARVASGGVDVVLMDLRMPGMGGVEAIAALRADHPGVRVLVLTTYDTDRDVLPAIEAGATGYLLKDAPRDQLIAGVRAAYEGRPVLAPSVVGRLMGLVGGSAPGSAPGPERRGDELSPRELEVLQAIAGGATNREIAAAMFISEATVKTHLVHLYEKLGARDRASAVSVAYQRGLLGSIS